MRALELLAPHRTTQGWVPQATSTNTAEISFDPSSGGFQSESTEAVSKVIYNSRESLLDFYLSHLCQHWSAKE